MRAHVFREVDYTPSAITSVCTNNSTIGVFRRRGTLELIDSFTLRKFVTIHIGGEVIQSKYRDLNTIVGVTQKNEIFIVDIETLEIEYLPMQGVALDVPFSESAFAPRLLYYSTLSNCLCEMRGSQETVLLREKSQIVAICVFESINAVVCATLTGWIRILQNNQIVHEVEIKETVTSICSLCDKKFAAVTREGSLYLFEISSGVVLDRVPVRKHPLHCVVFSDGLIHTSGVDSRIISYHFDNKLGKCCQADLHSSIVLSMAVDSGRVITAGEDTVLVFNRCDSGRYTSFRIYEDLLYGATSFHFFVVSNSSINFFKPNGLSEVITNVVVPSVISSKLTFRASSSVLESINPPETSYLFYLKFRTKQKPVEVAVSQSEEYLAYSTLSETLLYRMHHNQPDFEAKKVDITLEPATQLLFTPNYLIHVGISKVVSLVSLSTFKPVLKVLYEDYRERVVVCGERLVLTHSKQSFSIEQDFSAINPDVPLELVELPFSVESFLVDGTIVDCNTKSNGVVEMLIKEGERYSGLSYNVNGEISQYDISGTERVKMIDEECYVDETYLYVQKNGHIGKYDIGQVILGVLRFDDSIVIIQKAWQYLCTKFKQGAFKEKYSNR